VRSARPSICRTSSARTGPAGARARALNQQAEAAAPKIPARIDGRGYVTVYFYDDLHRLVETLHPDGGTSDRAGICEIVGGRDAVAQKIQ
jgi:YD repeat-containing protein